MQICWLHKPSSIGSPPLSFKQLVLFVHERHVPVRSREDLSLVQTQNKSNSVTVSEGRIRSLHPTNHMPRHISYSNAIGLRFSHSWQVENTELSSSLSCACAAIAPRGGGGRNFSEREIWVNGLRERERFVHLKDSFKKNDSFTNVTSLVPRVVLHPSYLHKVF